MRISDAIREKLDGKIIDWREHAPLRVYITIKPKDIREITRIMLKELGIRFAIASGQHTPDGFEILYHFSHDKGGEIFTLRVLLEDKKNPAIDSIATIFPGAEWIEREMWELLGIDFRGHPNLKRLLLSDDWPENKYPLRHEH